jgi:hypothetical protein
MITQVKEERGTNLSVDQVQANVYTRTHTHTHYSAAMNTQLKEERGTNLSVDQVQANVRRIAGAKKRAEEGPWLRTS